MKNYFEEIGGLNLFSCTCTMILGDKAIRDIDGGIKTQSVL